VTRRKKVLQVELTVRSGHSIRRGSSWPSATRCRKPASPRIHRREPV